MLGAPNPFYQVRRRNPLLNSESDDPSASRRDHITTDDFIGGPIGAFDQHVGLDQADHGVRGFFVKYCDRIDATKCSQHFRPLRLRIDGPAWPFVLPYRSVRVDRDYQRVPEGTCVTEISHVPGVQQVEHSIGENDESTPAANDGCKCSGFFLGHTRPMMRFHKPAIRMPLEKVQRCGGRKIPVSFTVDVTRMV